MLLRRISLLTLLLLAVSVLFATPVFAIDGDASTSFTDAFTSLGDNGTDLPTFLKNGINTLLFVAGVAAVIIIVVGAIRFVTSEGDSNQATRARSTVVYAAAGLVVCVAAYAIINFVLGAFS